MHIEHVGRLVYRARMQVERGLCQGHEHELDDHAQQNYGHADRQETMRRENQPIDRTRVRAARTLRENHKHKFHISYDAITSEQADKEKQPIDRKRVRAVQTLRENHEHECNDLV